METPTLAARTNGQATTVAHKPFRSAAVLGAGTMGAQIAAHLANAGLQVYLLDIAPKDGADKNAVVNKLFKAATKKKPDPFFTRDTAKRIKIGNFDDHFHWVGEVDWVIEAVVERLDIKHQVMKRIEEVVRDDAVISTNTSGIPASGAVSQPIHGFCTMFLDGGFNICNMHRAAFSFTIPSRFS